MVLAARSTASRTSVDGCVWQYDSSSQFCLCVMGSGCTCSHYSTALNAMEMVSGEMLRQDQGKVPRVIRGGRLCACM